MHPSQEPAGYRRIAEELRAQIRTGILSPGQRIMSVADLAHTYGVALGTAEHAVGLLREEGLIVSDRGRRSRVGEQQERLQPVPRGGSTGPARRGTVEECRRLGLSEGSVVMPLFDAAGREVDVFPAFTTRFTSR